MEVTWLAVVLCLMLFHIADGRAVNGLPWPTIPVSKKPCVTDICQQFKDMCHHRGRCELTPDCGARCICHKGFTGVVCETKVQENDGEVVLIQTIKRSASDGSKTVNINTETFPPTENSTISGKVSALVSTTTVPLRTDTDKMTNIVSAATRFVPHLDVTNTVPHRVETTPHRAGTSTVFGKLIFSSTTDSVRTDSVVSRNRDFSSTTIAVQTRKNTFLDKVREKLKNIVAAITISENNTVSN